MENLIDLHATKMVQCHLPRLTCSSSHTEGGAKPLVRPSVALPLSFTRRGGKAPDPHAYHDPPGSGGLSRRLDCDGCRLVVLISSLEVGDLVVALEVPDAGGDFVDQIMIVGDQKNRPLIALQGDVEGVDGFKV